ncbi:MAG: hypothetical protein H6711_15320 [Myxococcales bacterium]|nr:hypothetical protein [Myxococcales bacterium]
MISTSTLDRRYQDLSRWLASVIAALAMVVAPSSAFGVSPSTAPTTSPLLGISAPTTVTPDGSIKDALRAQTEEIERARLIVAGLAMHPHPAVQQYYEALYSLLAERPVETIEAAVGLAVDLADARMTLEEGLRGTDLAREFDELLRSGPVHPVEDRRPADPVLDELVRVHPTLPRVMRDARLELRRRFGEEATLTSEGRVDPESGELYAVLRVGTDLPLDEALRRRDLFDDEWWLDQAEGLLSVVVIDVELV